MLRPSPLAVVLVAAVVAAPPAARAQRAVAGTATGGAEAPDPQAERARKLFRDGARLFRDGEYQLAVAALEQSYASLPSPNTGLLIGRALDRLGRYVEAYDKLTAAAEQARARAEAGEARYRRTAEVANSEATTVRRKLGALRLTTRGAPAGTEVEIDGKRHQLDADGGLTLLHQPGGMTVVLHRPGAEPLTRSTSIAAGKRSELDIDLTPPPPPPPARPAPGPNWLLPAAVAGGVGLVGMGLFIGFGASAEGIRSDLESRCAPHCSSAEDLDDKETSERHATVANLSLVVGLVGLAASATFGVLALTSGADAPAASAWQVTVGPGGAILTGRF